MNYTILIVEDDQYIRGFLDEAFRDGGYLTKSTGDGAAALEIVREEKIDLVILDLGISSIPGEVLCLKIKKDYPNLPIIILTAKTTPQDVVKGLDLGADDYIKKPFETDELMARVKVRLNQSSSAFLKVGDLELDLQALVVKRAGEQIKLTTTELKLLEYLMINSGVVLSRENILNHIWFYSPDIDTRVVDVYIGYLRKKIDSKYNKKLIHGVRGFGYTLAIERQ